MDFNFSRSDDVQTLIRCNDAYMELNPSDALFMSHYELAAATGISSQEWKKYLTHPEVADWMASEIDLIKRVQLNKIIQRATHNDRSVGTAQMINALDKSLNKVSTTEGPAFIYTYVPLASNQTNLDNVTRLTEDIFWRD